MGDMTTDGLSCNRFEHSVGLQGVETENVVYHYLKFGREAESYSCIWAWVGLRMYLSICFSLKMREFVCEWRKGQESGPEQAGLEGFWHQAFTGVIGFCVLRMWLSK